jgi:cytochrome P450
MSKNIPPGPSGHTLLGSMLDLRDDPLQFLLQAGENYGDIFFIRLGPRRIYVLNKAEYIQEILVRQMKSVQKADLSKDLLGRFLGQGILTSDGDFHKRQRRLVQPAFHVHRIDAYANVMVNYTQDMISGWRAGDNVDIDDLMMRLTMNIVSKTLFDADVSDSANEVGEAIKVLQTLTAEDFKLGFMWPMWVPTARNRKIRQSKQALDKTVTKFIRERRTSGEDKGDLLSMLLLAQDEDDGSMMSDQQVRDEAVTLFAAGHETTSNALTWAWYLLSQNPQVEQKLHAEIDLVLGGRLPMMADLAQLPFTESVIQETLRLYPPAWILMTRTPIEPIQINGYQIDPGEWVWIAPYLTHRKPEYFSDPEKFDPDRFFDERQHSVLKYAYFPFGGGPRVCIGNAFAMMEARLILATIAQKYKLELVPGQDIVPEPEITLRSRNGLQVILVERSFS